MKRSLSHGTPVAAALVLAVFGCSSSNPAGSGGAATTSTTSGDTASATTGAGGSGGSGGTGGGAERPPPGVDKDRDILTTDLSLDVTTLKGKATITLAPSTSKAASFEVGDLDIATVSDASGPLKYTVTKSELDVGVPSGSSPTTVIVEYAFKPHDNFDGWLPKSNVSFLWPHFCGNLFPCKSAPADGVKFSMSVTGVPDGLTAVYPAQIPADAPSYMPAVAVGKYTQKDVGKTAKGTKIVAWFLPGQDADAATGTAHLVQAFEFYEKTYGDYSFGKTAGSVSADWGPGDYGGMEHHPYWHVGKNDFKDEVTQAHEAAHGWFGDGVRIQCWEDFVLSEGTVSYLSAHALETLGVDAWAGYDCDLKDVCDPAKMANTIALPKTCNSIDLLNDPLWSDVPYMKGAYFYRDVATAIGAGVLDGALAGFYQAHVGKAARMQEMIDFIKTKTDATGAKAVDDLETKWLLTLDCPVDYTKLCP
jgi:aminopeptidase N